jgi:hypothetical protein
VILNSDSAIDEVTGSGKYVNLLKCEFHNVWNSGNNSLSLHNWNGVSDDRIDHGYKVYMYIQFEEEIIIILST